MSPQGDRIAFVRYDDQIFDFALVVSDIDGTNEQVVATRKQGNTLSEYGLAWSPDGSKVVCPVGYWGDGHHMNPVVFDLKTGTEQQIGEFSWFLIYGVAWEHDTNSLIISARERPTSPFQLWRVRLSDGAVQKITNDVDEYRGVSLAGDKIVTVKILEKR